MASILVTGATGKQGGALIRSLVSKNAPFQILAVTRNTQSASAQRLSKLSARISLVQGDLDRPAELFQAAKALSSSPIWGVFSVQTVLGNTTSEEVQGKALVDEAVKNNVKHFVYSSVDRGGDNSVNNPTPVPHFIHKHNIEKHLIEKTKGTGMQYTILRPVAFYENLTPDFFGKVFTTSFKSALKGAPLQLIGVSDIGAVAAEVFTNPEEWSGRAISLAGDELTYTQFAETFRRKTGEELTGTFRIAASLLMAMMKDFGYMFRWFHDEGYKADVEEVRRVLPGVKDFGSWLESDSAGPSGLVMAKTLTHHFPPGTFEPVIFEKKDRIGGIWAVDYPPESSLPNPTSTQRKAFVSPHMRTNLSRFSVAFSDLSWETALGTKNVPVFPRAWEVRRYLERYADVYGLEKYLRLGTRVLRTGRRKDGDGHMGWGVEWAADQAPTSDDLKVKKKEFDFLVVASGHFGTPSVPHIDGLGDFPNRVHSSELQNPDDIQRLLKRSPNGGKLVVIGGSMSGVEAATSLALHLSSLNFTPGTEEQAGKTYEVWHIGPGPFWVLPTNLPHKFGDEEARKSMIPFVPLDLFLYDLDRRPPGTRGLAFGPISADQIPKRHQFFQDTLGKEYAKAGAVYPRETEPLEDQRPPWVGIADYYAEYVRSGEINTLTGKVTSVSGSMGGNGALILQTPSGHVIPLPGVAAIVMATGFKPSESLSFLPGDVLSKLEYDGEDDFLPLVLDKWSSAHGEVPDLGFVGFYRGAFWGPAEMQAQSLANTWAGVDTKQKGPPSLSVEELNLRAEERQKVREYRDFQPKRLRGQFPLGDYVGLMETTASHLDRTRVSLNKDLDDYAQPLGPVVPACYAPSTINTLSTEYSLGREVDTTLAGLRKTLFAEGKYGDAATTAAIFRALHGTWSFTREEWDWRCADEVTIKSSGQATFHPRYPSAEGYEAEYLRVDESVDENGRTSTQNLVYRHRDLSRFPEHAGIEVWSAEQDNSASKLVYQVPVSTPKVNDKGITRAVALEGRDVDADRQLHVFDLDQVAITKWVHLFKRSHAEGDCKTEYSRF
ncbi:hypothetical protein BJY04DRAFT_213179 [Aspergillus karnatakaensis]|uniref:uncharacterized protein n=1 Tax=Aspergillus karnatakaensis TaxID=1810916 RepID=UPI003CCC94B5